MDYTTDTSNLTTGSAASSSPQSRTRLVVAAQALDIQHLQDVIRTKDRELGENTRSNQEALEAELEKNRILTAKNARLESQVQLLAMKLHELEEQKEQQLGTEVSNMMTMAQSGKERDTLIAQLRDELKSMRSQNNALNQEREVILEKLVLERKKVAALENRAQSSLLGVTPGKQTPAKSLVHRSCQTSDMTLSESLLDDASVVPIETLKRHIELEQQELQYHQEYAARHAANTNELHARMQERLQYEVSRLNQEQEKYQSLLQSYVKPALPTTNASKSMSPAPNHSIQVQPNQLAHTPAPAASQEILTSMSQQQSASGAGAPSSIQETKARVPFFQQQEKEMQAIRERLLELQEAHNSGHPAQDRSFNAAPVRMHHQESHQDSVSQRTSSYSGVSSVKQEGGAPSSSGASSVLQRMLSKATQ